MPTVIRTMERYNAFIHSVPQYCKRSNLIPGDELVPTGTDICWAYKFVDRLPNAELTQQRICIPNVQIGSFRPGEVLFAEEKDGNLRWVRLPLPTVGVNPPSEFTCVANASADVVQLRWKDPYDKGRYVWKKTRVLKKPNVYPANENDGIIVGETTRAAGRDQYYNEPLLDYIPQCYSQINWFYRIFAYSEDDVVTTDDSCKAVPQSPEWGPGGTTMSQQIQNGLARMIFHVGDEITVSNGTRAISFVVGGFDEVVTADSAKRRSVTLITRTSIDDLVYDNPHPVYVQVINEKAKPKGTQVYYVRTGIDTYTPTVVETDHLITAAENIYVKETDIDATLYGSNVWEKSASRSYLNGSWINSVKALDSDFAELIMSFRTPGLTNVIDTVALPTIEQMNHYRGIVDMVGWSRTPDTETTYRCMRRVDSRTDVKTFANAPFDSFAILYIG